MRKIITVDIPGYKDLYKINSLGLVINAKDKILIGSTAKTDGQYPQVKLQKDNSFKQWRVHVLMGVAFLDYEPTGRKIVIDHINNIKWDNRLENLQKISHRDNCTKDTDSEVKSRGVTLIKKSGKFTSTIHHNRKNINLGLFNTEQEASKYYEDAVKAIEVGNSIVKKVTRIYKN